MKFYILLFTCASSCPLHLELTPDIQHERLAFMIVFERFKTRRGTPDVILNHNCKTFKSSIIQIYLLRL